MKFKIILIISTIISSLFLPACSEDKTSQIRQCPGIEVHFSPNGGVTQSIVSGIDDAKTSIHLNVFSFTSKPIAEALIRAYDRGVNVLIVADRENLGNPNSAIPSLSEHGILVFIDDKHSIAHNKVIIVDDSLVFTGSFNISKAAEESNSENSIAIYDPITANIYQDNWELHRNHSKIYK